MGVDLDGSLLAHGLLTLRPSTATPPPPDIACLQLLDALRSPVLSDTLLGPTPPVVRLEVAVSSASLYAHLPPTTTVPLALLEWLRQQPPGSRLAFSRRCGTFGFAGVGVCDHITGAPAPSDEGFNRVLDRLRGLHPHLRYVGGCSIAGSPDATPSKWPSTFAGFSFVLPRVEVALADGDERLPRATLAVHLRLLSEGADRVAVVRAELAAAQEALQRLCWAGNGEHPRLPPAASVAHSPEFPEYAAALGQALDRFERDELQKVVLARQTTLTFNCSPEAPAGVDPLAILIAVCNATVDATRYLFYFEPPAHPKTRTAPAFMSISPERLCRVLGQEVETEALAGTWSRADFEQLGKQEADPASPATFVLRDPKIINEHTLVSESVTAKLRELTSNVEVSDVTFFRMKHLVHLKQTFRAVAECGMQSITLMHWIVKHFHPTPAVCGTPTLPAGQFIAAVEPFDRGWYAAPAGYLTAEGGELLVALRSALFLPASPPLRPTSTWQLVVFAGAGLVKGSVAEAEWEEMDVKMKQYLQLFAVGGDPKLTPSAPLSLAEAPNINALWSMAVVEELVRLGVTHFVICPGARCTPLVAAVVRHPRTTYVVCNDERGAAYYAVGYGRAARPGPKVRPAAIIVTSGTAVANLLPGVVEAWQAHVPLLLLTADRPAELRHTGANQTILQPGLFSHYVAWEKDLPPPSLEHPLEALLADVSYAGLHLGVGAGGPYGRPVHLNFQFRENLAPDSGPVRGAPHLPADTFVARDRAALLAAPAVQRWLGTTVPFTAYQQPTQTADLPLAVLEALRAPDAVVAIVAGELRSQEESAAVAWLGEALAAPVLADVCASLPGRSCSADALAACHSVRVALREVTVVLRFGGPIISARLDAWLAEHSALTVSRFVVVDGRPGQPRMDPGRVATDYVYLPATAFARIVCSLRLIGVLPPPAAPQAALQRFLADVGRAVAAAQRPLLEDALTEPAVAQLVCGAADAAGAAVHFASSMPCRDGDIVAGGCAPGARYVCNRGASGIDGVISTAIGYAVATAQPVVVLVGDLATIHDLNALVLLRSLGRRENCRLPDGVTPAVHAVCVNNAGGAIFSFLPVAGHADIFTDCFATPHRSGDGSPMDFHRVAAALLTDSTEVPPSLTSEQVPSTDALGRRLALLVGGQLPTASFTEVLPALDHAANVAHHKALAAAADAAAQRVVGEALATVVGEVAWVWRAWAAAPARVTVLLHGWMGSKEDWGACLDAMGGASDAGDTAVLAVDLPGHGASTSSALCTVLPTALLYSPEAQATLLHALLARFGVGPARPCRLVAYSLGGRVAMTFVAKYPQLVDGLVVLGGHPGMPVMDVAGRSARCRADAQLARQIRGFTDPEPFLRRWYGPGTVFADVVRRRPDVFQSLLGRRLKAATERLSAADALQYASLGFQDDLLPALRTWRAGPGEGGAAPPWTYVFGALDTKYAAMAQGWQALATVEPVPEVGHAVPAEMDGPSLATLLRRALPAPAPPPPLPALDPIQVAVTGVRLQPFVLPLTTPLPVTAGGVSTTTVSERRGYLLLVQVAVCHGSEPTISAVGIGELCPLPGLPPALTAAAIEALFASLAEAAERLRPATLACPRPPGLGPLSLLGAAHTAPVLLMEVRRVVAAVAADPMVRGCLEAALCHAACRALGLPLAALFAAGVGAEASYQRSHVSINRLALRQEAAPSGPFTAKLKVGHPISNPADDARAVRQALAADPDLVVRLDANQAWDVPQAAEFLTALGSVGPRVQYLEEPIRNPTPARMAELAARGPVPGVPVALDESLLALADADVAGLLAVPLPRQADATSEPTEQRPFTDTQAHNANGVVQALILKPAALGLLRALELVQRWPHASHTVTSVFDSGVGLCFGAVLASALPAPTPDWAHGLGTFAWLQGDVTRPAPFSSLVADDRVSAAACEGLLASTADHWWSAGSVGTPLPS
eukprot:EG_transcript_121